MRSPATVAVVISAIPVCCLNMGDACIAGLHLIKHAAQRTLERGGQFVLLGSAPDPKIQARPHT